jgi:hypothetical protein
MLPCGPESLAFYFPSKNIKVKIYSTIILPDVLHGCETWSAKLRNEMG